MLLTKIQSSYLKAVIVPDVNVCYNIFVTNDLKSNPTKIHNWRSVPSVTKCPTLRGRGTVKWHTSDSTNPGNPILTGGGRVYPQAVAEKSMQSRILRDFSKKPPLGISPPAFSGGRRNPQNACSLFD